MLQARIDKQITLPTTQTDSGKFIYIHQFKGFVSLLCSLLPQREGREPGRGGPDCYDRGDREGATWPTLRVTERRASLTGWLITLPLQHCGN